MQHASLGHNRTRSNVPKHLQTLPPSLALLLPLRLSLSLVLTAIVTVHLPPVTHHSPAPSPSMPRPLPLALSHFPFPSPTSPPRLFTSGSPSRSVCCHEPPPFLYLRLCSSIWSSQQHDLLPSPLSSSILAILSPPPSPFDNQ